MPATPIRTSLFALAALCGAAVPAHAVAAFATAAPPPATARDDALARSVDALTPRLAAMAGDLWSYAEVGFRETRSAARLQAELKAAGFRIDSGVDGMPTAFIATAGSGGPVIALLAEYDALPGLSQTAAAVQQPVVGQGAGHACGHNLLGAASVTAAIALRRWLADTGTPGTVRLYGTPAEEGGFAKVFMVRDGLFRDVDVTLAWHPGDENSAAQFRMMAVISGKFRFKGVASHAAAAPERGRSALDGVEIMNVAANYLREHVPDGSRIQYVVTRGGDQPNIVPANAESFYYVRHYDADVVRDLWARIGAAAQGAALATGTTVTVEPIGGTLSTLPNDTLGRIADTHMRALGGFRYSAEEADYARRIAATLPSGGARGGGPDRIADYAADARVPASSDVGDVSWITPTLQIGTATWVTGTPPHSWQAAAASGASIGVKGAVLAAKTLALTGADLFADPAKIAAAKAEFARRRGPDFRYRPLIGDRKPALNYTQN